MPTVGLPRMHKEIGERRDFLPSLVEFIARVGASEIVIEEGYGGGMEVAAAEYAAASPKVRFASVEECFAQDVVIVLRCPSEDAIRRMRRGAVLVSMLHFPTRPQRLALLAELGVVGVSLDQVKEDRGGRLVQNMQAVGWNGMRSGFRELARLHRRFDDPGRRPLRVTLMGSGAVGGHAAHAAVRYGDVALRKRLSDRKVPGVAVTIIDVELTSNENYMLTRFEQTDMLVDATQRPDASCVIVPNDWVAALPLHAVIVDLSVDPYDFSLDPPAVKGIEGVPEGNLDKFVFPPDDPAYDAIDRRVRTTHRRTALACYSWPGLEPRECMDVYGSQIQPVLRAVIEKGLGALDPRVGPYYERATARASSTHWQEAPWR